MAINVWEQIQSRPIARSNGTYTATRVFKVWNDTTAITTPVAVEALFGTNNLPQRGDNFPDTTYTLVATDHSIRRDDGQTDLWVVEWKYTEAASGSFDNKQPNEVGYLEISASATGETVDCWRSLEPDQIAALTASGAHYANGIPSDDSIFDIGGRPIDIAGEPTSMIVRQVNASIGVTMEVKPKIGDYAAFIGRRNSLPFYGAGVGRVLYLGADIRRIEAKKWSVGHRFLIDEWLHMRQIPFKNPDGSPRLTLTTAGARTQYVNYVQPFLKLADLYQISPYLIGY